MTRRSPAASQDALSCAALLAPAADPRELLAAGPEAAAERLAGDAERLGRLLAVRQ